MANQERLKWKSDLFCLNDESVHGLENISPWLNSSQMCPEMAILEHPETQLRKSNSNGETTQRNAQSMSPKPFVTFFRICGTFGLIDQKP